MGISPILQQMGFDTRSCSGDSLCVVVKVDSDYLKNKQLKIYINNSNKDIVIVALFATVNTNSCCETFPKIVPVKLA